MGCPSLRNGGSANHTSACHECNAFDPLAVLRTFRVPATPSSALARFKRRRGLQSLLPRHDLTLPFTISHLQLCIFGRGDTSAHRECSRFSSFSPPLVGNSSLLVELSS